MWKDEIRYHLNHDLIPFWKGLKDEEHGGYWGYVGYDLVTDKHAEKGCILNSRILWFFSNGYLTLKDKSLLPYARHAYEFLRDVCLDREYGGVYWSVTFDGKIAEGMKHTYNQAFAIYALSSYYDASGDSEALELALELFRLVEEKCTDENGFGEAYDQNFGPIENEKLSENGVLADKTMNTLLHVFEAYTELYRVTKKKEVEKRLRWILETWKDRVYNRNAGRQEVFFDHNWNSLIDLYSYGHDIETAWLVDRGCRILEDPQVMETMGSITREITANIYQRAYVDHSLMNECENGVDDVTRVWWVQAEAVVGFYNGYEQDPSRHCYLEAAESIWDYIRKYLIDGRSGSEWFWALDENRKPLEKPIVEPWKCPYHNGRMCFEIIRRTENAS